MECKNGQKYQTPADIFEREIEWKRRSAYASGLQLALATKLPVSFSTETMRIHQYNLPVFPPPMPPSAHVREPNPFMNNMEEISYWVTTKRAPCLLNYDNVIKRQNEQAHCSKETLKTTPSVEVPHPKNKKRKLKLLDESMSSEKQQNIFFEKSLNKDEKTPKSVRSESLGSNVDFKIKPATHTKPKRVKVQKKNKEMPTKANKVCTSTPKITNLRRSLRKTRQSNNYNSQLNDSFEMLNSSAIIVEEDKLETKGDSNKKINPSGNDKNATNGKFEDSSDVSGFTANYIRSTKVRTSKTAPKVQNKSRNQDKLKKAANDNMIICVNKSVNTGNLNNTVLNCSTDSSHNIVNLVTIQQETTNNVDKSTSLLKFVDVKNTPELVTEKKSSRQKNINCNNTSFQSKSSNASRYPKRQRKISAVDSEKECFRVNLPVRTTKTCTSKVSNSDRKENSVTILSKTRSGRKIGEDAEISGCSRLNLNNSSEQVSSGVTLNVGSRKTRNNNSRTRCLRNKSLKDCNDETKKDSLSDDSERKLVGETSCVQMRSTRSTRHVKKLNNVTGQLSEKNSLRDKSGFANCFSDSDSDNEPLKQRKFFC